MKKFFVTVLILALIGACGFFAYKAGYIQMLWDGILNYSDEINPSTITKDMYDSYLEDGAKMEFTLSDDGSYYILTGNGENENKIKAIPPEYNGKPVKVIGAESIRYLDGATIIIIPSSVVEIENYAFNTSYIYAKIFIPSSVVTVGDTICAQKKATFCIANGTDMSGWSLNWNMYKSPVEYRDFKPQ